jgi:dynein heavy chain
MFQLKNYNKDNIPEKTLKALKIHMEHPDFKPEIVATKLSFATGMCSFCLAMATYAEVNTKVAPKKARVQESMKILEKANKEL